MRPHALALVSGLALAVSLLCLSGCATSGNQGNYPPQRPYQPQQAPPDRASGPRPDMASRPPLMLVNAAKLNLRSCAGTDCSVIAVLSKGDNVGVIETRNGWARVEVPNLNGKSGWVSETYLKNP